jgi:hypothetical protein
MNAGGVATPILQSSHMEAKRVERIMPSSAAPSDRDKMRRFSFFTADPPIDSSRDSGLMKFIPDA